MLLYWTIRDIVEVIEGCIKNKYDFICFVDGKRGSGKSTLIYKIVDRLGKRGVVKFNPKTSLVYSREETLNLLAMSQKTVIFSDEMINVSYKRDFFEQGQKQLIKGLNMYRDSCNVFIGAVPLFKSLDTDMKELCKMKLSVVRRGVALIYIQPDIIDILESQRERNKKKVKYKNKDLKMEPTKKVGIVKFNDITHVQRRMYEQIKKKKRGQVFNEEVGIVSDPMSDWYNKLYKQLLTGGLTKDSFKAIIRMADKRITTVRSRLGQMLRDENQKTVSELLKEDEKSVDEKESKTYKQMIGKL